MSNRLLGNSPFCEKKQHFLFFRIIMFLILFFSFNFVFSQSSKINLNEKNATLSSIIKKIEKQSSYLFFVKTGVNQQRKLSISVKEAKIETVLQKIIANVDINYMIEGSYIMLSKNKKKHSLSSKPQKKERIIKGCVSDINNNPLIGVNVIVKGTSIGAITDIDGKYSVKVSNDKNQLEFKYIGYKTIVITAGKPVINVIMKEDTKVLGEVVVTAMGIEKKASSLTYSTQKVDGDELTRAKDANFINALQGKTAGLVITPNSSGAGGSSKLLLRGNSSILGNNSPLIVVDGVPMSNRTTSQTTTFMLSGGGDFDAGDGLSNINPDDIENITVLKGANAAALYGSYAANGVVMITTKKGKEGRTSVEYSSSIMLETPLIAPEYQNNYGADVEFYDDVSLNPNSPINKRRLGVYSWGDKIGKLSLNTLRELPYARNNACDNVKSFFNTATNFTNSISISSGSKISSSYLSYANTFSKGLLPNNTFKRHNFCVRQQVKLFQDKVSIDFSANFILQNSKNRPVAGNFANPVRSLYLMPRNADVKYFENNSETWGQLYYINEMNGFYKKASTKGPIQQWPWINAENSNSPYWDKARLTEYKRERLFATLGITYKLNKELSAQVRLKIDRTKDTSISKTYQGTKGKSLYNSVLEKNKVNQNQLYADFLVSYKKKIGNCDISANVGGSTQKEDDSNSGLYYAMRDSTSVPNVFSVSNIDLTKKDGSHIRFKEYDDQNWENSLYATVSVGYKDMAYLDASLRTDWSRVYTQFAELGTSNHYTYYSIGGNVLLNKLLKIKGDILNHSKLRLSYSEVGNSIPNQSYGGMAKNWGSQITMASKYRTFYNPLPETMRSIELGFDARFFHNALDLDLSIYQTMMLNQWLPKNAATGGQLPLNSGKIRNRGLEISLGYNLSALNHKLRFRTGLNYSYNQNEILETYNNGSPLDVTPLYTGGLKIRYEVGKPYGELYGKSFVYDSKGKIQTDATGAPLITSGYDTYLGNANSPHHLGWSNSLKYKDFSFYFLIDGKIGGSVISYTEARLDAYGLSKRSGEARNANVMYLSKQSVGGQLVMRPVPGVIMPDGQIAPAKGYYQAIGFGEPALSQYVYDATNFRLREVSLGYTFKNVFGLGKNITTSIVARNLFFIYNKCPVDPDVSVSSANGFGGIEAFSIPTTRSYGFNLKISL